MPQLPINAHNDFYLAEDRRDQPKEYFKFLVQRAATPLSLPRPRVLDIGCATGDFLYYLQSLCPNAILTGIDVSPEFLAKARQVVSGSNFIAADIYSGANLPTGRFDVIFMSSVHYLFPDYTLWIRNILSLTGGNAYIFGLFNPEDLDLRATVQRSGERDSVTPWNLISQKSVGLFLDSLHVDYCFTNWELPIEIPRSHEDPLRSWTIAAEDGHVLVINGLQMLHRFALLEIQQGERPGP